MSNRASGNRRLGGPFWTLVTSSGLSNLADGLFKMALPLVAIHYTRSPALVAGLELTRSLPWLLGALQVGALTDRLDRRLTMVYANAVRAIFVAVPAVALAADSGALWLLYVAAAGTGIAEVFYDTASQTILPSLVPRDRLDRANGHLYAAQLGPQEFAGPPLAGLLVAASLALSFVTSGILWVIALVALLLVKGSFRPTRDGPRTTLRADIRQGLSFLNTRPILRTLAIMVGMSNLATSAAFPMLALFAVGPESTMGLTEPQFGILIAVIAAGGLAGSLFAGWVQTRLGRARTLTMSVFGIVPLVATPALTASPVIIAIVFFVGGLAIMLWNITTVSFRQRVTPDHLLGRINSTYRLIAWGTIPIGAALGGALGEWLGVRGVFAVMGILTAAVLIPDRRITEQAMTEAERGL